MNEKKIAECINVRINVGNYQHIDITKYAEKVISYETKEEMILKEDELTQDLLDNVIRNMRTIPSRLGKETEAVDKYEDSIKKSIPEWLANDPIPNIVGNGAIKQFNKLKSEENYVAEKRDVAGKEMESILSDDLKEIIPQKENLESLKKTEDDDIGDIFSEDDDLFK